MTDATSNTAEFATRPPVGWAGLAVAVIFALFYAYDVWEAVSNVASIAGVYELFGLDPADAPWWLLVIGVLVPVVVYAAALLLGRGRGPIARLLILVVGLAVVAVLSLDIVALEGAIRRGLY
jgi:hypothetical protein